MGSYKANTGGRAKRAGAMLLGTVASGALVAGSLNGLGVANAACFNISGFGIGDGCEASFGSVAIVLGPSGEVEEGNGSFAIAGDPDEFSPLNFAFALGSANDEGSLAAAGVVPDRFPASDIPNIANVSFSTAGTEAFSFGALNLAGSFGGTDSRLIAGGAGNSALNIGSGNNLLATGIVNNATSLFGDHNFVGSGNVPAGEGLAALFSPGLNVGFNLFGNDNSVGSGWNGQTLAEVQAGSLPGGSFVQGPLSIVGAIGVNDQGGGNFPLDVPGIPFSPGSVKNSDFGITLRTPFNVDTPTSGILNVNRTGGGSTDSTLNASKAGSQLSSSLNKFRANVKTFNDNVKAFNAKLTKAFGGLTSRKTTEAAD